MMGLFMSVMAAVMLLSGAGIDRLNEQKAKNQQAQPMQITYALESAGTSNEPEQATEQNDEPVLAAEGQNEVTAPAAGMNNAESVQDAKVEQPVELAQDEVPHFTWDMINDCNGACNRVAAC